MINFWNGREKREEEVARIRITGGGILLGLVGAPRFSLRMLKMQGVHKAVSLKSIRKRSGEGKCSRWDVQKKRVNS